MAPVTTFLKHWLDNGEVIPLTTNAIESAFSQVNNRIKRVEKRWSEQGLLNWLKVTFYKIFKPELWTTLWNSDRDFPKIKLTSLKISRHWFNANTQLSNKVEFSNLRPTAMPSSPFFRDAIRQRKRRGSYNKWQIIHTSMCAK